MALANKLARIAWALLKKGTRYRGDDVGDVAGAAAAVNGPRARGAEEPVAAAAVA